MLADLDMTGHEFLNWVQILLDAQYPNALLRDGSRKMLADLDMGGHSLKLVDVIHGLAGSVEIDGHLLPEYSAMKNIGSNTRYWKNGYFTGDVYAGNVYVDTRIWVPLIGEKIVGQGVTIENAGDITGRAGKTIDMPLYKVAGVAGVDGNFTTVDEKTVTVTKGLITSIA